MNSGIFRRLVHVHRCISMKNREFIVEYILAIFLHFGVHRLLGIYKMAVTGFSILGLYT